MEFTNLMDANGIPRVSDLRRQCYGQPYALDAVLSDFVPSAETREYMKFSDSYVGVPGIHTSHDFVSSISQHTGRSYESVLMDSMTYDLSLTSAGLPSLPLVEGW